MSKVLGRILLCSASAVFLCTSGLAQSDGASPVAGNPPTFKDYVPCYFQSDKNEKELFTATTDVLCSFSLLEFNEASDIFGKRIAKTTLLYRLLSAI